MKRYASLIRKLVDATAEAESAGKDVADVLKSRCFNETSLIRQTLMNAVCDPRFKIDADVVGYWKDEARHALEQLAEVLENTNPLTEETAYYMLDKFLSAWLGMTFEETKRPKLSPNYFTSPLKKKDEKNVEEALDFLEGIGDMLNQPSNEDTAEKAFESAVKGSTEKNYSQTDEETDSDEDEDEAQEEQKQEQHDRRQPRNVGSGQTTNIQRLEEHFLQKIPQSLVDLARRIGRMGENGVQKAGKFMSAGKSDIAGITVGNDISAVLPSELAMLAEKRTQDIFLHNFTARRLQLFASASQSKSPDKHQDGPVIICVDTSSSMAGEPMRVAMVLAVAVAIIAWRRKRDVIVVKYSDSYDYIELGHSRLKLGELIQFFSQVNSGGNNENAMFRWLFKDIKPAYEEYDSADILCVSDFGWTLLTEETEQIIEEQKKQGMRFYGLNVNAGYPFADYLMDQQTIPPMEVCDSVWSYVNGECKEVKKTC